MKILNVEQNTDAWLEARKGKITGSKLGDIVVRRGNNKKIGFYELMADRLAITEAGDETPLDRGHRLEEEAIAKFMEATGKTVERVGMWLHDQNENIACSPDGAIKNGEVYDEVVEVKCLSAAKHLMAYFEKKVPSDYEEQRVQPFIINPDLKKLYFVFYDPRVTAKPLHWLEITREEVQEEITFLENYQRVVLREIDELLATIAF